VLGACNRYSVLHEEVHVRVRPEDDELHVLEIQRGLQASRVETATAAIDELLARRRIWLPGGGPIALDFDRPELAEELRAKYRGAEDLAQRLLMCSLDVTVERTGLFLEDDGTEKRLGWYRLTRVARFAANLDLLNDLFNFHLRAKLSSGEALDIPSLDSETLELWRRHAEQEEPWILLEGEALVLEIPVGSEKAATDLVGLLGGRGPSQDPDVSPFRLDVVEVTSDHARLRFPARWIMRGEAAAVAATHGASLLQHYVDRGYDFAAAPTLAEIRTLLDRR
jgi:hypothetical protein